MKTITFKFKNDSDQEAMSEEVIKDFDLKTLEGSYDNSDPDNLLVIIED